MRKKIEPFEFKQCVSLIKSTGKHTGNLRELRELIAEVSEGSIFHHTYQYFLKGNILEYTNDFAQWAGECLEERALAERLSCVDPYLFKSIVNVRKELIGEIDGFLSSDPKPREVRSENQFYFNETVSLVFPAGARAKNLAEFLVAIEHIEAGSIYYHFYDSRVRLGEGVVDDFSRWIEHTLMRKELADRIRSIDPFIYSLEKIREHIKEAVKEYVRADMKGVRH